MKAEIIVTAGGKISRLKVKKLAAAVGKGENTGNYNVNIVFIGDRRMATLNRKFRHKTGPTDVLSFSFDQNPGVEDIFGEIYISVQTAKRNAIREEVGFDIEILRLCCHGMLHLLGYDHTLKKDRIIMQAREDYYLGMLVK